MMTSTPLIQPLQTDGRTVREVVECNQELVNEVWCRRVIRQLLQSLEMQYAMGLPHRPINPDTVLVLESGDPILLPSSDSDHPDTGGSLREAGDMHDLAAVIHYAITREAPPAAPLRGRVPDYNPTFTQAIDRCLSTDPEQRPRNIDDMRNLLGIVQLGAPIAAQPMHEIPRTPVQPAPEPAAPPPKAPAAAAVRRPLPRWLLLVAAAAVLLGALGALIALLQQTDTRDTLVMALPEQEPATAPAPPPMETLPAPLPADAATPVQAPAVAPPPNEIALPAGPAPAPGAPQLPAAAAPPTAIVIAPTDNSGTPAAASGATYKLDIKPWGLIQVNGVNHGASPPIKRITLPPGQHTIRIVNPNYPEHTVTVNATKGHSSVIELDFTEEGPQ